MSVGKEIDWYELFPNKPIQRDLTSDCATTGFHVTNRSYAVGYKPVCVEVEFNPKDALVVPAGVRSWKIRVAKFKVLRLNRFKSDEEIPYVVED